MNKPKFFTPKFIECAIRFMVYFLAVAITPLLVKPIAPLFDWVCYGLMRPVFIEGFTIIFWGIEWLIIFKLEKNLKKKELVVTEQVEKTEEDQEKQSKFQMKPPLPLKNVFILTAICVVCIFTISAVIGFKVKPVYDLGEKIEGYDLYNRFAWLGRQVFKCFWILGIVKACEGMAGEICITVVPANKSWMRWVIQAALLLVFGLFDVFVGVVAYPLDLTKVLIAFTYILFYVAFVPVRALTEKSDVKAFLLILLIYLF